MHKVKYVLYIPEWGKLMVAQLGLRHCATNRKATGLILDGVTGIFH
jgi:hypothetical protein